MPFLTRGFVLPWQPLWAERLLPGKGELFCPNPDDVLSRGSTNHQRILNFVMDGGPAPAFGESGASYCFGPFRLDPDAGVLLRGGQPVPLTPKAFDALLCLIKQSGRLVSKDELIKALWRDAFVAESNLTQTIFVLRKALVDTRNGQRYIATVPGRGYRFVAEVQRVSYDHPKSQTHTSQVAEAAVVAAEPWRGRSWVFLSAIALLLMATVTGYFVWWRPQHAPSSAPGRKMLAVLPFENLTGDPSQEYFSNGLTEEMITQLGSIDPVHLGVIGRSSVMRYKGGRTALDQISRELDVQYLLEGSVRRTGNRVRIDAQLIQGTDQTHLWARKYDRELKDILDVQGEIAQEITDEIQLTLGGSKSPPAVKRTLSPQQVQAYDLYLKGQYFFNQRTVSGFQGAISCFQQATAIDANHARAYAGLADAYALISGYSTGPQAEFDSKAHTAALKALEIDPNLPEAHTALALIVQEYDWDWQTAEKEFRRAIELNPNYATAHHWYAEHLMWRGHFDEALQESERARQLDPLSLIIATDYGAILFFSRQYDRAIEKWRSILEMDPDFPRAHLIRAAYVEKGMFKDALADLEKHGSMADSPWYWSYLAYISGRAGQKIQGQQALDQLLRLNRRKPIDPMVIADAYTGLGDKDQALAWLERGYAQHSAELMSLKVNPGYDFLRDDPRFQDLLRRVGLDK